MRRSSSACILVAVFAPAVLPLAAQQPSPPPQVGEERVQVTLVQIDALVLDKDGKTVPGLTNTDFTMKIGKRSVKVDTVDFVCPIGPSADPAPLKKSDKATPPILGPGVKRRIVFAFDYAFLDTTMRNQVLDAAEGMLRMSKAPEEEVMIVALTSEVRVEQKFTTDIRQLVQTLSRMKHDVTLWARDVPVGTTGRGYFQNIATLMDVLGSYSGAKGVVYFSQAGVVGASMRDLYYNDVAAHAAASRGVIYPAKPDLLDDMGPGDTLVRLANGTGGRVQFTGNDLSVPYRRAQRDILCRYTLGAYIDPTEAGDPEKLSVRLNSKPELQIRTPEQLQLFTDEAKAAARVGAAYVDPGPFERPLVRAFGFSAEPAGADTWDTLLAVNFPAPATPSGADIDVKAAVRQDKRTVDEYKRTIHVDPAAGGATPKPVTILGNKKLKSGQYDLDVVLTDKTGGEIVAARTNFVVPQVVPGLLILRGPIMGKVVPGGQFLGADPKDQPENTRLGKLLGPSNGFEPLFVEEIERGDKLLFYWSACVHEENPLHGDVVVSRTFFDAKGEAAKAFDPVPLKLEDRGKDVSCLDKLESLDGGTLASGEYRLDVTVAHPNGDLIARGTAPLNVR